MSKGTAYASQEKRCHIQVKKKYFDLQKEIGTIDGFFWSFLENQSINGQYFLRDMDSKTYISLPQIAQFSTGKENRDTYLLVLVAVFFPKV